MVRLGGVKYRFCVCFNEKDQGFKIKIHFFVSFIMLSMQGVLHCGIHYNINYGSTLQLYSISYYGTFLKHKELSLKYELTQSKT